jgi:hypothetical protein
MRLVEVYQVSRLPKMRPPYVTKAYEFTDEKIGLLEVNPSHPVVKGMRDNHISVIDDLKRRKFGRVKFIWQGRINGDLLQSRFFNFAYFCELCGEFHAEPDEEAFSQFLKPRADDALMQMFLKFGVLAREPLRRAGGRKTE